MNGYSQFLLSDIALKMHQSFDISELKILCTNLGVVYEDIQGDELKLKINNLVAYFARRAELNQLIEQLRRDRPKTPWPELPTTGGTRNGEVGLQLRQVFTPDASLDFVNRDLELQDFCRAGYVQHLFVEAPCGLGKSRLLDRIIDSYTQDADKATQNWLIARVSLSDPAISSPEALCADIARQWSISVSSGPSWKPYDLAVRLRGATRPGLLLVDDCHQNYAMAGYLLGEFLNTLEDRVGTVVRFRLIMTGNPMGGSLNTRGRIRTARLSPFSEYAVADLLGRRAQLASLQNSIRPSEYSAGIYFLSGGHPVAIRALVEAVIESAGAIRFDRDGPEIYLRVVQPLDLQRRLLDCHGLPQLPSNDREDIYRVAIFRRSDLVVLRRMREAGILHTTTAPLDLLLSKICRLGWGSVEDWVNRVDDRGNVLRNLVLVHFEMTDGDEYRRLHNVALEICQQILAGDGLPHRVTDIDAVYWITDAVYHYLESRKAVQANEIRRLLDKLLKGLISAFGDDNVGTLRKSLHKYLRRDPAIRRRLEALGLATEFDRVVDTLLASGDITGSRADT
jgi:hypothetical protein